MYILFFPRIPAVRGFTLVELLIVIVIFAILAGIAIPNFAPQVANNRATAAANDLLGTLQYARSEAVKLNATVTVCSSPNPGAGSDCTGATASWDGGWVVRRGNDTIRVRQRLHPSVTITGPPELAFNSAGSTGGANNFTITIAGGGGPSRCVQVTLSGNATVTDGGC